MRNKAFLLFIIASAFFSSFAAAESYVCTFEAYGKVYGNQKELVQRVLVREGPNVFVDKAPGLKELSDAGIRFAYVVYQETEKGLVLVDQPFNNSNLNKIYPSIGIMIIQKDTGKMYHTNLSGDFIKKPDHNRRFRIGICSRME